MSIKKQYLKSRPVCKVSFRLDSNTAKSAKDVSLVGDFNNWQPMANPMKALKSGAFSLVLDLPTDCTQYQFRYLMDGGRWENDAEADGFLSNGMGGENSIVRL